MRVALRAARAPRRRLFQRAGVVCEVSDDPVGVELAGCAKNAAAVAVGATEAQGLNAAGMAVVLVEAICETRTPRQSLRKTVDFQEIQADAGHGPRTLARAPESDRVFRHPSGCEESEVSLPSEG